MSYSNFPDNPKLTLVADASVIINLNATRRAADILSSIRSPVAITDNAWFELEEGRRYGYDDADRLRILIQAGLIHRISLGIEAQEIYQTLIDGRTAKTLDDGEASTIGKAVECGGMALIDERKARSLCAKSFPGLKIASTVELLMHERLLEILGVQGRTNAITSALMGARMRVPPEYVAAIKELIGAEKIQACTSLPKR